jgi:hypothetical protein
LHKHEQQQQQQQQHCRDLHHSMCTSSNPVWPATLHFLLPRLCHLATEFCSFLMLLCAPCRARARVSGFTFLDWLQLLLPCVRWLRTYRVKEFLLVSGDMSAQNNMLSCSGC